MAEPTSLLNVLDGLLRDPAQRAAYASDPDGYLAGQGWDDLSGEELAEAMVAARHALPVDVAADLPDAGALAQADPYAALDQAAGAGPLDFDDPDDFDPAAFDVPDEVDPASDLAAPAFGAGAGAGGGPGASTDAASAEPAGAAGPEAPEAPDSESLAAGPELPEPTTAASPLVDPSVHEAEAEVAEAGPDDQDDWLDPLNP